MTSPLRLCVRRSPAPDAEGAATLVTLRLPSDVTCIEEAVELVTRHCLAGHAATRTIRFRLQVVLSEALANAILRGNRESLDKWVDIRAELHDESTSPTRAPGSIRTACRSRSGPSSSTKPVGAASSSSASSWTRCNSTSKGTPSA